MGRLQVDPIKVDIQDVTTAGMVQEGLSPFLLQTLVHLML